MNQQIPDNNRLLAKLQSSRNTKLKKEIQDIKEELQNEKSNHQKSLQAMEAENIKLKEINSSLKGKNWNLEIKLKRSEVNEKKLITVVKAFY